MGQKTNRATKAMQEINHYIKICEKAGIEQNTYRQGAVWAFKTAQDIIRKRKP